MDIKKLCEELIKENEDYQYSKTFKRHLRDLDNLDKDKYRFNKKMANMYINVLQSLKHSTGTLAGQNIKLEKWQIATFSISMGWEQKNKNGIWIRRFSTQLYFMGRKNGKTLIAAGLSLADTLIRPEAKGELVCIATKSDQSLLALNATVDMIKADKKLSKIYKKRGNKYTSTLDETTLYNLGSDSTKQDGLNISVLISDEAHAMRDSSLMDVCTSSMGARLQPLHIIISTAGFNLASPLVSEIEYSRKILDEELEDENYFCFLAEPNEKDDSYTLETLKKSNPNLGVSISEEFLIKEMETAIERNDKKANYLTKYVNKFVNSSEEFISIEDWKNCRNDDYVVDYSNIKSILVGADLSVSEDLTSLVIGYLTKENDLYIKALTYMPEDKVIANSKNFKAPLQVWVDRGYLTTTKGKWVDLNIVYEDIKKVIDEGYEEGINVEVYYDAYKFRAIKERLENELNFTQSFSVNQNFRTLSEPLNLMSNHIQQHKIIYKNNAVFNWAISNVVVVRDKDGNIKIDKSSRQNKIDPVASLGNIFYGLLDKLDDYVEEVQGLFYV